MKKRITALLAAVVLMLGLGVVAAPAANAGTCTVVGPVVACGRVYNGSSITIRVTSTWPAQSGYIAAVPPGSWSPYKDTDGFYVPPGKCFGLTVGPAWVKINDLQTIKLNNTFLSC